MQSKYKRFTNKYSLIFLTLLTSCQKLVEADPPITSVSAANVYNSNATAAAVLTGIYSKMSLGTVALASGANSVSFFGGLSADELSLYSGITGNQLAYYTNALTSQIGSEVWNSVYPLIFTCNSAIEGLTASSGLTPSIKQQLLGESKFLRAFFYFYLVNLYGDVPLSLSSDYTINAKMSRTPRTKVWEQIIVDLEDAKSLLSSNFLDAYIQNTTSERVRPTRWAAMALLSRSYLYTNDWVNAQRQSDSLITNSAPFALNLSTLDNVFLKNESEAIWQLQPVSPGISTLDGSVFIVPSTGPNAAQPVYLNHILLNDFEAGDQRRTHWVDSVIAGGVTYYFPYKYKVATTSAPPGPEYTMVFRLGEQYLISAEARAQQSDISGALADLNRIRERAGLTDYSGAADQTSVVAAIMKERRVELFTEWGHRWFDLKRTGTVDAVMGDPGGACTAKGGHWNANWQWYSLPLTDLQADPNLVQNTGY
jgi:hypothetical protein